MSGDRLIATFREKRTHQAIVIDAQSRVVGIVSLDDLLTDLLGTKEEAAAAAERIGTPAQRQPARSPRTGTAGTGTGKGSKP